MFLYHSDDPQRILAIPQASHAWLAWQLAGHWGNRRFNRPLPRAEVLAAVMLHDSGWTEFDVDPGIDHRGRPRTFDRMPVDVHLDIWRACVDRAALHSRYAALLIAGHFSELAEVKTADQLDRGDTAAARLIETFRAEMTRRIFSWQEALATDARYRDCIRGPRLRSNADLLTLADRASVYFCASLATGFELAAPSSEGGFESVAVTAINRATWRLRPWPMEGDRARLQCEGRLLSTTEFESSEDLRIALERSPVERLTFTLVRSSAVG
jgi:hypothetical protein